MLIMQTHIKIVSTVLYINVHIEAIVSQIAQRYFSIFENVATFILTGESDTLSFELQHFYMYFLFHF